MDNSFKGTYVFDLDGTLCNISHRLHLIKGEKKDFDAFYDACDLDSPKFEVITVLKALYAQGFRIVIASGRRASTYDKTLAWLEKLNVNFHDIFMRPNDDYTPDEELKRSWLYAGFLGSKENILGVFDDRQRVVNMWRQEGLTCFQVEAWEE